MLLRWIEKAMELLGVILMATICVTVFAGVVFRYGLHSPLGWVEEVARYALVWVTYVGTFLALRRARHLSIDVFVKRASPMGQKVLAILSRVVILPFAIVMIVLGVHYATRFMGRVTPYLRLPIGIIYFVLPVIGVLLVIELVTQLHRLIKGSNL